MYLFSADNIVKRYSDHLALDHVTIKVPEGSIYGLLGPNGAGKTTFLRIINRISGPDEGEIVFMGRKFEDADVVSIGYLPEERGLYKKMKVGEQALYLARLKGMSKTDAMVKLKYWFGRFQIQAWWNKKVEELSKGMQQKIQFITTIIHEPKLLIFDEPFSGLDPINVNILKNEVLELKKKGTTIIFSTHDMGSVEELCDYITLIHKSKTILEGAVHEIKMQHKTNTFEIGYAGNSESVISQLNAHFQITGQYDHRDIHFVKIRADKTMNSNEMLNLITPVATVVSFNEIIPKMNEIFINVVEARNK